MIGDNETRALKLLDHQPVGRGEGETYTFQTPTVEELTAALTAAETRGRIAGLKEAQMVMLGSHANAAYREITARLAALSTETTETK